MPPKTLSPYAQGQGVQRQQINWLDTETMNTWNSDVTQNQKEPAGEYDTLIPLAVRQLSAFTAHQLSGRYQRRLARTEWPKAGAPQRTTINRSPDMCTGHQFTADKPDAVQKSKQSRVDQDVAC